jgi:hypothetical protein
MRQAIPYVHQAPTQQADRSNGLVTFTPLLALAQSSSSPHILPRKDPRELRGGYDSGEPLRRATITLIRTPIRAPEHVSGGLRLRTTGGKGWHRINLQYCECLAVDLGQDGRALSRVRRPRHQPVTTYQHCNCHPECRVPTHDDRFARENLRRNVPSVLTPKS